MSTMALTHVPVGWALLEVTKLPNRIRVEPRVSHRWVALSRISAKRIWVGFGTGAEQYDRESGQPTKRPFAMSRYRFRVTRIVEGAEKPAAPITLP